MLTELKNTRVVEGATNGVSISTGIILSKNSCQHQTGIRSLRAWHFWVAERQKSGDSTRTLSRTAKRNSLAWKENDSGEDVLEVHGRTGFWW